MQVVITRRAARDITQNFDWLSERSKVQTERWRNRLLSSINTLESDPRRCPLADESELYDGAYANYCPASGRMFFEFSLKSVTKSLSFCASDMHDRNS